MTLPTFSYVSKKPNIRKLPVKFDWILNTKHESTPVKICPLRHVYANYWKTYNLRATSIISELYETTRIDLEFFYILSYINLTYSNEWKFNTTNLHFFLVKFRTTTDGMEVQRSQKQIEAAQKSDRHLEITTESIHSFFDYCAVAYLHHDVISSSSFLSSSKHKIHWSKCLNKNTNKILEDRKMFRNISTLLLEAMITEMVPVEFFVLNEDNEVKFLTFYSAKIFFCGTYVKVDCLSIKWKFHKWRS